jgi:aldose 1-epimerase
VNITRSVFGQFQDQEIYLFRISNSNGVEVCVTNFGAAIASWRMPDDKRNISNIVLGYDSLEGYITDKSYMGCIVGRFADRIHEGRFSIDGHSYQLPQNEATQNHLHGGKKGFNKKVFEATEVRRGEKQASVTLHYLNKDMEEGYPGNLDIWVEYALNNNSELTISYRAKTDKATPVNFTNHSYFNLSGTGNALNQELLFNAIQYVETDKDYIPTGAILEVENSPYDFTKFKKIGQYLNQVPHQGYNECFVLDKQNPVAAELYDPESGRKLIVRTTLPAILFYSGDYLGAGIIKTKAFV